MAASRDVVVVGATNDDVNGVQTGSAYVYRWDGLAWIEEQKLLASDGADGDRFGRRAVAAFGDVVVVGAMRDDDNGRWSGSAYVYRWGDLSWIEEQKLLASDGADGDYFGYDVAASGDVVVVGAPRASDQPPRCLERFVMPFRLDDLKTLFPELGQEVFPLPGIQRLVGGSELYDLDA